MGSRAFAGSLSFVFHVSSVLRFLLRCSADALPAIVAACVAAVGYSGVVAAPLSVAWSCAGADVGNRKPLLGGVLWWCLNQCMGHQPT